MWVAVGSRSAGGEFARLELKRSTDTSFAAQVPAGLMQPPGIAYYIASEDNTGKVRNHFASPEAPHVLQVRGETAQTRLRDRLARHRGHRSSFRLTGVYHLFGRQQQEPVLILGHSVHAPSDRYSDRFWTTELEYTYRILRMLYDIRFGIGVMRGQYPTVSQDGKYVTAPNVPAGADAPGINYGYSEANFEFHRNYGVGLRLLFGASEEGFAPGIGGSMRIGPVAGTHLELGGEVLTDVGNRGWLSFAWTTVPRVPMALTIELSQRPRAGVNPLATLLFYDLGYELTDRLTVAVRAGYAARQENIESGYMGGVGAKYEF